MLTSASRTLAAPCTTTGNMTYRWHQGDTHRFSQLLLGDVAIIHAAMHYRTADGEERRGRYTDVWARRGGQWLAVSPHVTP